VLFPYVFFFFSSRRRHTRFSRDWSSDVCSSDLILQSKFPVPSIPSNGSASKVTVIYSLSLALGYLAIIKKDPGSPDVIVLPVIRSEERRVGKECRSRWTQEESKKKKRGKQKT